MALSSTAQSLLRESFRTWNKGSHEPVLVTYSFATESMRDAPGLFNEALKSYVTQAMQSWAGVSGLVFIEVPDLPNTPNQIGIRWSAQDFRSTFTASSPAGNGDIGLKMSLGAESFAPGNENYGQILQAIGYAIGLNQLDSSLIWETVMAKYNRDNPIPTGLGSADLEAVQFIYGTQAAEESFHTRWSWDAAHGAIQHVGDGTDQTLKGTAFDDRIFGYGGNDTLTGDRGNDLLAPGTGANRVDGGDGIDTLQTDVLYRQVNDGWWYGSRMSISVDSWLSYDAERRPSHASVSGSYEQRGEKTLFQNIEIVQFTDGRLVFDLNDPAMQATRLYKAIMGREADSVGREFWTAAIQHGHSLAEMATGFMGSTEFAIRFGTPDDTTFIARAYTQALGREAEAAGMEHWRAQLAGGLSRAELLAQFSESSENRLSSWALSKTGVWDADDSVLAITRLYKAVLDRRPDAEGLHFWNEAMDAGTSIHELAGAFAGSAEFQQRFGAADDAAFIERVYVNTLGRAPDAGGAAFWLDQMQHGLSRASLVLSFSESQEFILQNASLLNQGGIIVS